MDSNKKLLIGTALLIVFIFVTALLLPVSTAKKLPSTGGRLAKWISQKGELLIFRQAPSLS